MAVATTTTAAAASAPSGGIILSPLSHAFVAKRRARSSGGRSGGWSHSHAGEGRLVTTMRHGLLGTADIDILLGDGRGKLETGGLGRYARYILLEGVEATSHGLVGGQHAHVEVLLLCSLDLLLLLLQQLDLLLDGELLHCINKKRSPS